MPAAKAKAASLATAIAALEDAKHDAALKALLDVWAASRDQRVAGWIDAISSKLVERRKPIKGKTVAAQQAAWATLASKGSVVDVPVLLAPLSDVRKADELFKPIRTFAAPVMDLAGPMPFPVLQTLFDGLYPAGLQWYWKADFFR